MIIYSMDTNRENFIDNHSHQHYKSICVTRKSINIETDDACLAAWCGTQFQVHVMLIPGNHMGSSLLS